MAVSATGRLFGFLCTEREYLWVKVGVLTVVRKSQFHADRLILVMEYEEDLYGAAVTFSDDASCNRIFELLKNSVGLSIEDIGNIELSHTL
jgi:hypothetical protein